MKQVFIKKGGAIVDNVPAPSIGDGEILVRVTYSLISTGTELNSLSESGKGLIERAQSNPSNVGLVIDMAKKQGIGKTWRQIQQTLDSSQVSGYSAAGVVVEAGKNTNFSVGDRVACAGAGKANHSEMIAIPKNLAVKIPAKVTDTDAASVALGSIALQGVRQAAPELGDKVVVTGLGLIGLLTVQMLKTNGCTVIGLDPDASRLKLAQELGADYTYGSTDNAVEKVLKLTDGQGADRVVITAATKSHEPVNQAMAMTRKRGVVVVVGSVGLELQRSPFYEKEIDFRIACSYGPGRYDQEYEEAGRDYPYGFVRWTENRNMAQYLEMIGQGKVSFSKLQPKEYSVEAASQAYEELRSSDDKPLAALLKYPTTGASDTDLVVTPAKPTQKKLVNIAVIGAGGFASAMHLPNLQSLTDHYSIAAVVDKNGAVAKNMAERYGAKLATTNYQTVLKDKEIDAVLIATRHNVHAELSIEALKAGKAVLVEKPLALTEEELKKVSEVAAKSGQIFMVGFNRRFSPFAKKIRQVVEGAKSPVMAYYRMNAGYIPANHWVHGAEGGGRIVGEACHIIDLFSYLTGAKPVSVSHESISTKNDYYSPRDNVTILIKYSDGSVCSLIYTSMGPSSMSKEYLELFVGGKGIVLDDYQTMVGHGVSANLNLKAQDKGHRQELIEFAEAIKTGKPPISLEDMSTTTQISFMIV